MVAEARLKAPPGTSLRSLVRGFILTKQTEGKSPRTIQYYDANLKRFLWYAGNQGWPARWPQLREKRKTRSLRQVAGEYGVSHETIRRILRAIQYQQMSWANPISYMI